MRSRKGAGELVETRRHVVRLADEEDFALPLRLRFDHGSDRAQSRRKERPIRREAIGGSHGPPFRVNG